MAMSDAQSPAVKTASVSQGVPSQNTYQDEIDLLKLWQALWCGKWIVIAVTSVFALIGIVIALSIPNHYQSKVVLVGVEGESAGGSLGSSIGGLAAIAGINIGGGSPDRMAQAIVLLQSWPFLEEWVNKYKLSAALYAADGWNPETGDLIYDAKKYDSVKGEWLIDPETGKSFEPLSIDVYKSVLKMLTIEQDKKAGLLTVSFEFLSPNLADEWLRSLVVEVNEHYRSKDISKAKMSIDFLEKKISQTSIAEMQTNLYSMIEAQLSTLMLAEVSPEYLLETVVPSRVAEEKSGPRRSIIVIVFAFLGGVLAAAFVVARAVFAAKK